MMKSIKLLFLAISLLNTLPVAAAQKVADSEYINIVKNTIKESLKDPDSAKFYDVSVIENTKKERSVCGLVNAKNSYGGYVGKRVFFSHSGFTEILNENDPFIYAQFSLSGCGGVDKEKSALLNNAAEQGCTITWGLLENSIINKIDDTKSIDIAIKETKNNAMRNNRTIDFQKVKSIKEQYNLFLNDTKSNKQYIDFLNSNLYSREIKKSNYMQSCIPSTVDFLKKSK